jgi:hypothetical protein
MITIHSTKLELIESTRRYLRDMRLGKYCTCEGLVCTCHFGTPAIATTIARIFMEYQAQRAMVAYMTSPRLMLSAIDIAEELIQKLLVEMDSPWVGATSVVEMMTELKEHRHRVNVEIYMVNEDVVQAKRIAYIQA